VSLRFLSIFAAAFLLLDSLPAQAQLANGRLGLSPNLHWIGDITGASTVYYTNDQTAHSDSGPWSPGAQYDFFDNGAALCHQPWAPRPTAGAVAPPAATSCAGTYVGSGSTDANGQFNQHKTPGPARRWDIWNYQNRELIDLQVLDVQGNVAVTSEQGNWHPITANSNATFIVGLPQPANCEYLQQIYALSPGSEGGASWGAVACGWGASFANPVQWTWPNLAGQPQGYWGQQGDDTFWSSNNQIAPGGTGIAEYTSIDNVGVQQVWAVYIAASLTSGGSVTFYGKNAAHRIMHVRFSG